ncbi:MAG: hypothetical protein WCB20_05320, partial [Chthoniobacterales bacterium]
TGGLKSIGAEETCSSRCAVACIDISLSDFENDGVLQVYDIWPDHNWLDQTEHDRITLDHFERSATSMKAHDAKQ